ncbi:helicase [Xenorhabdus sp. M]|uniref:Helicase n=1 Tax=Xenorhabdus szentirmaii TaxID=290112 RepID=A0AAW3YX30_9GAMM|nr:AAA domain-containing protein [Xenorhabdus sp. M]MBD2802760.1 helicase [Xenorhabdus sp. M]
MSEILHSTNVLRAWQHIEFFQPYSPEKKKNSLTVTLQELRECGDDALPWLSQQLRHDYKIPGKKVGYSLHIGLFEKAIAKSISEKVFHRSQTYTKDEIEQRLDNEDPTCFAKVILNSQGALDLENFSISSLPWALGHLQNERFNHLNAACFSASCNQLKADLTLFDAKLRVISENDKPVLRAGDILILLEALLVEWADFQPEWQYAIQIDWLEGDFDKKLNEDGDGDKGSDEDDADEEEISPTHHDFVLPILNSYFFEDIGIVINALHQGKNSKALKEYLSHSRPQEKTELYSQQGLAAIIKQLHPSKMPLGRWPSEPAHAMSLMQQFAINTAIEELADGGLLSVNGPPGTGKTTLLRDLVAHNIVERAKILADFSCVAETLDSSGLVVEKLTGFEMIVASSNNAAVENISKELPQKKSLAKEFQAFNYLSPVANQLATEKKTPKKTKYSPETKRQYDMYFPLDRDKQCWGMISAALGKKANRNNFGQRLLFDEHFLRDTHEEKSRPDDQNFLSLWRWHRFHIPTSFAAAKKKFHELLSHTDQLQETLEYFAYLLERSQDNTVEKAESLRDQAQTQYASQLTLLKSLEADLISQDKKIDFAKQQQKITESNAPGWFTRLINRKRVQQHRKELREIQQSVLAQMQAYSDLAEQTAKQRKASDQAQKQLQTALRAVERAKEEQARHQRALAALQQQFPDIKLPDITRSISDPSLQRTAFWQNEMINRKRSELFIAAMDLHQAWLYEALKNSAFVAVVLKLNAFLSSPGSVTDDCLRWWQTLFMVVPVLSTTFASLGRMFDGVGSEELGWLMIDEAGQTSPQQAVGGIWRAKRVLVVGDPLQIEPVFTTSPQLVEHFCNDALAGDSPNWEPSKFSVQQIADRANHWGCELGEMGHKVQIGIPLWVHRRCIEPMFSLANVIAYDGRMIHGSEADKILSSAVSPELPNHWRISAGGQGEKQYRNSHGDDLVKLLDKLLAANVSLCSVYVITPFKAVKAGLQDVLAKRDLSVWQKQSPALTQKEFDNWKKHCVGTVHTFQGKENDIVIFVLGCDKDNDGGARWAASKPNLLNVALTRAKKHFFVIGDPAVWQRLSGFNRVAATLPSISPGT